MADFTLDDIKQRSMAEITAMQARRHGEKTFLHFLPRDERISYAGFDRRSSAVGRGLKAHGVQAGAHVGLILDNCPEMILAVFALAKIGAVWVPINTAAKGKLLVYYLDFADITTLIVHEKYLALIAACLHELPRLQRIVVVDDGSGHAAQQAPRAIRYAALEQDGREDQAFDADPWQLGALLFTSGTTGPSKAVMWPQAGVNVWAAQNAMARWVAHDDVEYVCLPLFHANALLNSTWTAFVAGATVALTDRYSTTRFWSEIRQCGATRFNSLGAIVNFLWTQPPTPQDRDHKVRLCSMAPVPPYVHEFEARFGVKVFTGYGLSDYCLAASTRLDDPAEKAFSCGKPRPGIELRIVDDNDIELPAGQTGEIALRSHETWSTASGYYKMPEATLQARRNFLFHTGDRGYLDADGYLYFVDRKKDSIRRRGENISSQEVEAVLMSHPEVVNAAVYPVRGDLPEDEVGASVLLRPGSALSYQDLTRYCVENMSYYMVPRFLEFVDALPLTESGKIEKFKLKQRAEQRPSPLWDREAAGIVVSRASARA
ncbi:AMP-binding protein [Bordetella bronchiseptica]|uniref:AMP-binding protein n=1 Tax=Bordetella bronchiseptica TaxID=518 RepID=UPI000528B1FF|nr:AMP-binding protein [Bordetella bronchiseptica]